jgi:threonine/homoserine/homoserine lactone efflux protein
MSELVIFIATLAFAYSIPGPDMIFMLQTSSRSGFYTGLIAACGLAIARCLHILLAAAGLVTLFKTAAWSFEIVRFAGAAYLIWMGIGILRTHSLMHVKGTTPTGQDKKYGSVFLRGMSTNLLNPKSLLFCSVLLPQFIRPDHGPLSMQFLQLGMILVFVGLCFDSFYALTGSGLMRWLESRPVFQTIQRYAFGFILIAFGADLTMMPTPF